MLTIANSRYIVGLATVAIAVLVPLAVMGSSSEVPASRSADDVDVQVRQAVADESWWREVRTQLDRQDQAPPGPVTTELLLNTPSWTAECDQDTSGFGFSVSTAGDVNGDGFSDVIVGAYDFDNGQTDEGQAFVYYGSATGLATVPAWTAESNQAFAHFGFSVGTAGDVNGDGFSDVIVGAYEYDNTQLDEGRAFVYHGSPTGPSASPSWIGQSSDGQSCRFGRSVGTAGDVNGDGFSDVIIGGRFFNGVFVFHGSSSGLEADAGWTAASSQIDSKFGWSAGTAGDVNGDGFSDVIVGAEDYNNGQSREGRACVYHGSATGLSVLPDWTGEIDFSGALFGASVATAGDVNGDGFSDVIVGAPGVFTSGRARVYHGSAAGLGASPAWSINTSLPSAHFGASVATAGDINGDGFSDVIVGTPNWGNGQAGEGAAVLFSGSSTGLPTTPNWIGESNQAGALFGTSVATAGDVNGDGFSDVLIGAHKYDNFIPDEGRAYAYYGFGAGLADLPSLASELEPGSGGYGYSVSTAGDVNGDGFSDLIVGTPFHSNGQGGEGGAFVFHGAALGVAPVPAWSIESNQVGANLGNSVSTAGDVNGDGFDDVIIGAYQYRDGQETEGRALVYYGSVTGLGSAPAWTVEGNEEFASLGTIVATAGDVNGDGYADVIVGVGFHNNEPAWVYIYHGSTAGLPTTPSQIVHIDQPSATYLSASTAGDVNGDGFSDVIIGSADYDNGQVNEGRVFVYHGSPTGLGSSPGWSAESDQAGADFGYSVGTAGDVNGDGYSDVIIGSWQFDNGQINEGRAFVYHGSGSGLLLAPSRTVESNVQGAFFGNSVATAGDIDGDGFSDVIVGAYRFSNPEGWEGGAFAYHGSPSGVVDIPEWSGESGQIGAEYGNSVASAGDVNGDGFADVIIGAHQFDNGVNNEGKAFLYLGNDQIVIAGLARGMGGGGSAWRSVQQLRTDESAPIALRGESDSDSAFKLKTAGRSPLGRGIVRLQAEVKPAGVPFDGLGLLTGPPVDTGAPAGGGSSVLLTELVNGLVPETLYHWRLRVLSNSPFYPSSPWRWLPGNAPSEADLRTRAATTAVESQPHSALGLWLAPGEPNPFNPRTTIAFRLPARAPVHLAIYDIQGRLVRALVDDVLPAGQHAVEWDGRDGQGKGQSTGIYLSRLESGGEIRSHKLALVK